MFLQTIAHFATRAPTIRFRAALKYTNKRTPQATPQQETTQLSNAVLDYQLPQRYHRKPLSSQEIDSINTGGATSVVKYPK